MPRTTCTGARLRLRPAQLPSFALFACFRPYLLVPLIPVIQGCQVRRWLVADCLSASRNATRQGLGEGRKHDALQFISVRSNVSFQVPPVTLLISEQISPESSIDWRLSVLSLRSASRITFCSSPSRNLAQKRADLLLSRTEIRHKSHRPEQIQLQIPSQRL